MKFVVIYNTANGEIISQTTIADETISTNGFIVEVPEGKILDKLDVSDPLNPSPVFKDDPDNRTKEQITNSQLAIIDLDSRVSALEEKEA